MFKIGNWKYLKTNNTLNYKSDQYSYEIDLDRSGSPESWIKHLVSTKNEKVMPSTELKNLISCYEKLGLSLEREKLEQLIDLRDKDKLDKKEYLKELFDYVELNGITQLHSKNGNS